MSLPSVDDAVSRILLGAERLGVETVDLADAVGRTLAAPIVAERDQPPFDASAMDGWAARAADVAEERPLRIVGESAAGRGHADGLNPGEAVRIFTGAPVPVGADRVVMQEEATREGDAVRLHPAKANPNIRARGGDFRHGDTLLEAGVRIDPWRLSLAASAGAARLAVARRPRVAVFSTGEELVRPGQVPGPWAIFESTAPALAARARGWGADVVHQGHLADDEDAIVQALSIIDADLIVSIGGASVGDYDFVRPAAARLGLQERFAGVALRPGKPTAYGRFPDGRRFLILPGNPASALVCAELFLKPLLLALQGADPTPPIRTARLAAAVPETGPREHWMRARLSDDGTGGVIAEVLPDQDSSLVTVFASADALIRRPAGTPALEPGAVVEALALERCDPLAARSRSA